MSEQITTQPEVELPMSENTPETVPTTAPIPEPRKLKVKVLHEEKELTEEEAIPYIQKGMDYDRVKGQFEGANVEKQFVEKLAKKYGMPVAQFKAEMETAAESMRLGELTSKGIPEEFAKEMLENREFRNQATEEKAAKTEETRRNSESASFLKKFPNVTAEQIPSSVWVDVASGIPLAKAYAAHERDILADKFTAMEKQKAIEATNAETAAASPGSTSGGSPNAPDYYTEERVNNMTTREIADNYDKIMSSRKHWK